MQHCRTILKSTKSITLKHIYIHDRSLSPIGNGLVKKFLYFKEVILDGVDTVWQETKTFQGPSHPVKFNLGQLFWEKKEKTRMWEANNIQVV